MVFQLNERTAERIEMLAKQSHQTIDDFLETVLDEVEFRRSHQQRINDIGDRLLKEHEWFFTELAKR